MRITIREYPAPWRWVDRDGKIQDQSVTSIKVPRGAMAVGLRYLNGYGGVRGDFGIIEMMCDADDAVEGFFSEFERVEIGIVVGNHHVYDVPGLQKTFRDGRQYGYIGRLKPSDAMFPTYFFEIGRKLVEKEAHQGS